MSEEPKPKSKMSISPKTIKRIFEVTGFLASIATIIALIISLQDRNSTIDLFRDYLYFIATSEASNGNETSLNATQVAYNLTLQSADSNFTPIPATTRTSTLTPSATASLTPSMTPTSTLTFTPTFTPTPDALFRDDFSDNQNGWDLSGSASIANGVISITAKPKEEIWLTIPGLKVNSENYLIQAKMAMTTTNCGCYAGFGLGFGLGEKDISYHKFFFTNWVSSFNFRQYGVNFFDNGEKLYSESTTDKIWLWSEYHAIRIEVKSGQVTLYHDGINTITKQITPYGNDLGFYVVNYENGDLTFSFDDVVVKEIP